VNEFKPRARAQLAVHMNVDGRMTAVASGLGGDVGPDGARAALSAWSDWTLLGSLHGNLDRGAVLILQEGRLVNMAQAILGCEKDGKRLRVVCRETFGAQEPDDWKTLEEWGKAGWTLGDQTGNLEHGCWIVMRKLDQSDQLVAATGP
jgi:hypothetical protein